MNAENIQNIFLTKYNQDPILQSNLSRSVDPIHQIAMESAYPIGEEFREKARTAFISINEIVISTALGEEAWKEKYSLFLRTMRYSTAEPRPADEAALLRLLWDLGRFGYSLVVKDKAGCDLGFSTMWKGTKQSFSETWER